MKLIVGLGNPGKKYEKTRHNIGFRILDYLKKTWHLPCFRFNKDFEAEIIKFDYNSEKVILAKPQTFMNLSGRAVQAIIRYFKIDSSDLIVIYDDIDIPLGKIRINRDGSAAGHKGLQSIIDYLNTDKILRIRVGIKLEIEKKMTIEKFVLQKFSKKEEAVIEDVLSHSLSAIEMILSEQINQAMNKYN